MGTEQFYETASQSMVDYQSADCERCVQNKTAKAMQAHRDVFTTLLDWIGQTIAHRRPRAVPLHERTLERFERASVGDPCPQGHTSCSVIDVQKLGMFRSHVTYGRTGFVLWTYEVEKMGQRQETYKETRRIFVEPDGTLALDNPPNEKVVNFHENDVAKLASSGKHMTYRDLRVHHFGGRQNSASIDLRVRELMSGSAY